MANSLYTKGKENLLSGSINLTSDTIKVQLIDAADYTVNLSTHDYLDDVAGAALVGTAVALGSKTFTNGTFDAADSTFTSVTGDQSEALIIYKDTGSSATSPLIAYIDTATGLPVTPTGANIIVTWHASGIFSI